MKIEEEKEVTYVETDVKYYCDVCNNRIVEKYDYDEDKDAKLRVEIRLPKEYYGDYDGGYEKGYVYDICVDCFEKEIKPLIDSKIKPTRYYDSF